MLPYVIITSVLSLHNEYRMFNWGIISIFSVTQVGELYQALKQEVNPDKGHRSRDLTEKIQSLQRKLEANASSKRE